MYGPTGIGVMYGKRELLDAMPPYQGGGDMIASVTFEKTIYNTLPHKFEAGTPNVAGVVGFGAAIDYVKSVGLSAIGAHEHELIEYAEEKLLGVDGVRLIGTAGKKRAACHLFSKISILTTSALFSIRRALRFVRDTTARNR